MERVSVLNYDDYRAFLKDVLTESSRKNSGFSLRAFARLTGMSPSHLSRTLNGQKSISASTAHQISMALKQSPEEADHFVGLIELEKSKDETHKSRIIKRMVERARSTSRVISIEAFQVISEWYHFAILSLTKTRGFKSDPNWIAKRLGIRPLDAKLAIDRLIKVGLLEVKGQKLEAVNNADISTTDDISSAAIQENHSQNLKLADQAQKTQPVDRREFNNMCLSMNVADVPEAKKMIREFFDKFDRRFKADKGQEVFQLNVQFYQMTKESKGK